jgi:hypothetical protein
MMRKKVSKTGGILLLFIVWIGNFLSYSQQFDLYQLASMPKYIDLAIESVNIPHSFKRSEKQFECFDENEYLYSCHHCIAILGYSPDDEFALLMCGPFHQTVEDSIQYAKMQPKYKALCEIIGADPPAEAMTSPNVYYQTKLKVNLNHTLQRDAAQALSEDDYEKYVSFYPEEYARTHFNADLALSYYCWPKREEGRTYQGKYTGSQALLLNKKDKGFVVLYCFYTENSKDRINDFMKEIEGVVWFKD